MKTMPPTKQTTHTPTPWKLTNNGPYSVQQIEDENYGERIAYISGSLKDDALDMETHEANAAFIVLAVNQHQELVDTLKGVTKAFKKLSEKYEPDNIDAEWLAHAHEAIARAEGSRP